MTAASCRALLARSAAGAGPGLVGRARPAAHAASRPDLLFMPAFCTGSPGAPDPVVAPLWGKPSDRFASTHPRLRIALPGSAGPIRRAGPTGDANGIPAEPPQPQGQRYAWLARLL